jgi:outer membrane protein assembly factor BamB
MKINEIHFYDRESIRLVVFLSIMTSVAHAEEPTVRWEYMLDTPSAQYSAGRHNTFFAIAPESSGGVYAAAEFWPASGEVRTDVAVVRLDPNGEALWTYFVDTAGKYDEIKSLETAANGDIILGGKTWTGDDGMPWVMRMKSDGSARWKKSYPYQAGYWSPWVTPRKRFG